MNEEELKKELINIQQKIENKSKSEIDIINVKVNHTKFGAGIVVNFNNQFLEVEFREMGTKKFKYPEAFSNNFLTCDNIKINEQAKEIAELYREKSSLESKILEIESKTYELESQQFIKEKGIKHRGDISNCMVAVVTVGSYTDNIALNLYYDKVKNGYSNYGYLGLYKDKTIAAIGKIENIIKAYYINDTIYYESVLGFSVSENQKERIKQAIDKGIENQGWDNLEYEEHYYFLVENFLETDFEKVSEGALWGRKKFDLCDILDVDELPKIEEIANKLRHETWE